MESSPEIPPPRRLALADLQAVERQSLPGLAAVEARFEEFAASLTAFLAPIAGPLARFAVGSVEPARDKSDVYGSELHWLSRQFKSADQAVEVVARIDHALIYALCEAAFGGDGGAGRHAAERRRSSLELRLADTVFLAVEQALPQAFPSEGTPLAFRPETAARKPHQPKPPPDLCEVSLLFSVFGHSGEMTVGLGKAALKRFAPLAAPQRASIEPRPHPDWGHELSATVGTAGLSLEAILCEFDIDLGDVAGFRPGTLVALPVNLGSPIRVVCEDQHLLDASFARSDTAFTLTVRRLV